MFASKSEERIKGTEIDLVLERVSQENKEKGYVPSYDFAICLQGEEKKVGGICLRIGDNENIFYGGHIGYGVDAPYRGCGFATKACLLLRDLAISHAMKQLIITCNPENTASRRTIEKLGASLVEIVDLPVDSEMYLEGERRKCRYVWTL